MFCVTQDYLVLEAHLCRLEDCGLELLDELVLLVDGELAQAVEAGHPDDRVVLVDELEDQADRRDQLFKRLHVLCHLTQCHQT